MNYKINNVVAGYVKTVKPVIESKGKITDTPTVSQMRQLGKVTNVFEQWIVNYTANIVKNKRSLEGVCIGKQTDENNKHDMRYLFMIESSAVSCGY